ncbi:MAG: Gfo/Idh/MocA family oxidoreductase [Clostridia bacterium]|nr:Gfo/Idh/MocA family oxidoreductase [Clostridia bacterium]
MEKKIRIGIIGVGNIAESHIKGYKALPNVELYAFCDIDEAKLKMKGEKHGVTRLFTDMNEMLALPEIDAVSVCTWNAAHAPCTIAALNAGKHVLCEKPMATTVEEAEEMKAAAEKAGKLLMIGFVRRFGNDCAVVKDFVDNGFFGELYYAKCNYLRRNGCPGGWFSNKELSGGGPLIDLGVHVIDLVRYLFGNPKPISVYGATFDKLKNRPDCKDRSGYFEGKDMTHGVYDVEDLATALIRFDNGAVLQVECSFTLNLKKGEGTIQLFGSKAGAKLDPELEIFTETNGYMSNVQLDRSTGLSFANLFENEIAHFVNCVDTGAPCRNPAEDGVQMMRILSAIYESAKTGHEVIL